MKCITFRELLGVPDSCLEPPGPEKRANHFKECPYCQEFVSYYARTFLHDDKTCTLKIVDKTNLNEGKILPPITKDSIKR